MRPVPAAAPTRADVNALATYTWLETTAIGRMAVVLAAHPEGGPGAAAFARALRLADPADRMPYVGVRIAVDASHARLRLDGCAFLVELAVGPRWAAFVAGGGPVALIAGLDPLPRLVPPDTVSAYLRRARLRLGTTGVGLEG